MVRRLREKAPIVCVEIVANNNDFPAVGVASFHQPAHLQGLVSFQENIRSFHLLARSLEFPHGILEDSAFLIRQFHNKLFATHGDLVVDIEVGVNSQEYLLEAKGTQS